MNNDIILPNKLKYPQPLRGDMVVIDHISYLLSDESNKAFLWELERSCIPNKYTANYGNPTTPYLHPIGVTVAYSKNRINLYPLIIMDQYDAGPEYTSIPDEAAIRVPFGIGTYFDVMQDINGAYCIIVGFKDEFKDVFTNIHKGILNQRRGEWSQGDYLPFIKIGECSTERAEGIKRECEMINASSNQYDTELVFNIKRYMRFSEKI